VGQKQENKHKITKSHNKHNATKAWILKLRTTKNSDLSFTLEHGSINSSLAATRATQPSASLFRYTKGVFPINCKE